MAVTATILIPDISGYTTFVTKTELEHSSHIVTELLGVLAEANPEDFTLAEVEGDALLLYRKGPVPSSREVVGQCLEMFLRFHERLAVIERDSICRCGACQTASGLGVKFIVHVGKIREIRVAGFTKPAGVDMIIAHRLLKSGLSLREYILVTEAGVEGLGGLEPSGRLTWGTESSELEGIGEFQYRVASLEPLRDIVPEVAPRKNDVRRLGDASFAAEVDCGMADVYRTLLDMDLRNQWIPGVVAIDHDATVPRLGLAHVCRFEGMSVEFRTVGSEVGESDIVYVEEGWIKELGLSIRDTFVLRSLDPSRTEVTLQVHWPDSHQLPKEVRQSILDSMREEVQLLKEFCELRSESG